MHIPLLNSYIGCFLEDLKLVFQKLISYFCTVGCLAYCCSMIIFMWTSRASALFKNTYFICSFMQEFAFLSAVIPFVWVPVSLNPNKAVYSSAIWVTRRINPDTKVSLSTATLKAATSGIVHTHTGCKIKIRNPPNLYSETQVCAISSSHLYLALLLQIHSLYFHLYFKNIFLL